MRTALALLFAATLAAADTLHMKNGGTMEGKILSEEGDEIPFKLNAGGQVTVKRSEIEWFEWSDKAAAKAEFEKRKKAGTSEALVAAAAWAKLHGMTREAEATLLDVIAKDPQNAAARQALGHRQLDGKWLSEDEYMKAMGHVKVGGKWVTLEEKRKLDEGWEWVEGKFLPPDEAKAARGLVQHEGKWITRKQYDEIMKKKGGGGAGGEGKAPADPGAADKKRFHSAKDDAAILKIWGAGWRVYSGERYRLITNCDDKDPEFDKKFVETLDAFWATYCDVFDRKPEQKKLHNVVVHQNKAAYLEWCGKYAPGVKDGYGTYLHGMAWSPAVLYHSVDVRTALYTGRHEAGHQFVAHYLRGDGGAWFQEGIAAMFEPDIPYYLYPYRWDFIRGQVFDGKDDITMADLIKKSASLDANQVYSRGAATHWFFLTYKDGVYKKKYQQYMAKGNLDSPDGLEKVIGKPIAELDKEYREFIREMDARREKEQPK